MCRIESHEGHNKYVPRQLPGEQKDTGGRKTRTGNRSKILT